MKMCSVFYSWRSLRDCDNLPWNAGCEITLHSFRYLDMSVNVCIYAALVHSETQLQLLSTEVK